LLALLSNAAAVTVSSMASLLQQPGRQEVEAVHVARRQHNRVHSRGGGALC
jgi:hypothetical protein